MVCGISNEDGLETALRGEVVGPCVVKDASFVRLGHLWSLIVRSCMDNECFTDESAEAFERRSDPVRFIFNEDAQRDRGLSSWK